jgi:hypothetical protein
MFKNSPEPDSKPKVTVKSDPEKKICICVENCAGEVAGWTPLSPHWLSPGSVSSYWLAHIAQ